MDTKAIVIARRAQARAVVDKRRSEVEALMAVQVDPAEIQRRLGPKHGVSDRTIRKDIAAVWVKWDDESTVERPKYREQARRTLRRVIQSAFAAGNYNAVVRAQCELSKIDGLHADQKHIHTHKSEPLEDPYDIHRQMAKMTSGEKRAKLASIIDKYAPRVPEVFVNGNGSAHGVARVSVNGNGHANGHDLDEN